MSLISAIKRGCSREFLARLWRFCVPSVVVSKRVWGLKIFFDLRDNIDDFTRSREELESREPDMQHVMRHIEGSVWDVGCNIGFFAYPVAIQGNKVLAFDISEKAIGLLRRTVDENGLDIETVARGVTTKPVEYALPSSSHKTNKIAAEDDVCTMTSLSFEEAAGQYGVPALVKMDIEGGEAEFFESDEYKRWIVDNGIVWLVELHPQTRDVEWPDVPHRRIGNGYVAVYHADPERVADISPAAVPIPE